MVMGKLLRTGDRVRMKMDPESRPYFPKAVPDGTEGTVVGKYRATGIIEARYPILCRKPGVYELDGVAWIQWDSYPEGVDPEDEDVRRGSDQHLEAAPSFVDEYNRRYKEEWPVRNEDGSYNMDFDMTATTDRLENRVRVGDLPETPFYELDLVEYQGTRYLIRRINYNHWGPDKRHCYEMSELNEEGRPIGSTTVEPNDLTLIERGNVWKFYHNEPLSFKSLDEEASFAKGIGKSTEVRNPKDGFYSWTLEEVLEAIRVGIVDGFYMSQGFFGVQPSIVAQRFEDRDLGERVLAETLKGFADKMPEEVQ